ncbi:MAG TPA: DsbA family protein [Candidatus Acidoferrales bacterium]|nr:DsbA family protein [Candidatus Acidoferrales bacterium]
MKNKREISLAYLFPSGIQWEKMKKLSLKKPFSKITKSIKKKNFKIPRFKNVTLNTFLVVTIVVFAFFLGMLTNKVFDLQQQLNDTKSASAAIAAQPNTALQPPVSGAPAPSGPVNVAIGDYPVQGDSNAKVTVIEFADFRCPFCEQWFKTVEPQLMKDYVNTGKVKFAFRNYAFLGPASTLAAEAGECANDQNQFWAFHDYMYDHQPDESDTSMYTVDNLSKIAGSLGMDQSQFNSCLSSKKFANAVTKDLNDGSTAGVNGTPTTFVNGMAIVGAVPYAQLKQQIDTALKN